MSEEPAHYGPMTEQRAREILRGAIDGDQVERRISARNTIQIADSGWQAKLGGYFSADELEAIAWWMRNKTPST